MSLTANGLCVVTASIWPMVRPAASRVAMAAGTGASGMWPGATRENPVARIRTTPARGPAPWRAQRSSPPAGGAVGRVGLGGESVHPVLGGRREGGDVVEHGRADALVVDHHGRLAALRDLDLAHVAALEGVVVG